MFIYYLYVLDSVFNDYSIVKEFNSIECLENYLLPENRSCIRFVFDYLSVEHLMALDVPLFVYVAKRI